MEVKTIQYDSEELKRNNEKIDKFKKDISIGNIIYLFYFNNDCLYIGESGIEYNKVRNFAKV